MTLAQTVAEEIFRTIERENRINKDDLIAAVERASYAFEMQEEAERRASLEKRYGAAEAAGFPISTKPGSINWAQKSSVFMDVKVTGLPPPAEHSITKADVDNWFGLKGHRYVCSLKAGGKLTKHPSGDGFLFTHPDDPPKWIKTDGTIEEIKPK